MCYRTFFGGLISLSAGDESTELGHATAAAAVTNIEQGTTGVTETANAGDTGVLSTDDWLISSSEGVAATETEGTDVELDDDVDNNWVTADVQFTKLIDVLQLNLICKIILLMSYILKIDG